VLMTRSLGFGSITGERSSTADERRFLRCKATPSSHRRASALHGVSRSWFRWSLFFRYAVTLREANDPPIITRRTIIRKVRSYVCPVHRRTAQKLLQYVSGSIPTRSLTVLFAIDHVDKEALGDGTPIVHPRYTDVNVLMHAAPKCGTRPTGEPQGTHASVNQILSLATTRIHRCCFLSKPVLRCFSSGSTYPIPSGVHAHPVGHPPPTEIGEAYIRSSV